MHLITAATEPEMRAFTAAFTESDQVQTLITGVGPVETAVRLSSYLAANQDTISAVINLGVAGAYSGAVCEDCAELLDICLAEREILGELGIAFDERLERFSPASLPLTDTFVLDASLLDLARRAMSHQKIKFKSGTFITVSAVSGTAKRGAMIAGSDQGLCENMEGAAVARACKEFGIPCLEIRCISNLVEDRDRGRWKLQQACQKAGATAALVTKYLISQPDD